ncbi:WD40 repeat domain-containing protein [Aspergillus aculeatinus CBS 121060]|uniref:WD40 repeat-like protein n=1 Tax=Aspergillus aculeatinus CBS 121060 TaxID=1448322 RepID=A0ACD1H388_9EURO|nr:WD40 repeat-like protein [Aspergillus aculeatinus CBS 121060]RAH68014.1 WD40 repeat-like protein [Aspergillus aculeatinus CBS 121060]
MTTPQTKPPATPTYILRGHAAQIHSLHIYHHNLRLVSGDADGWIAVWDLVSKRPVAVWKAHDGAVLGVHARFRGGGSSGVTEVFTHGRDHKLRVWRFSVAEEVDLRRGLPVDSLGGQGGGAGRQPWLVHSLPVNALNFCAFAWVDLAPLLSVSLDGDGGGDGGAEAEPEPPSRDNSPSPVLIAVPNALNSGAIDLFHLPTERRVCTIPADGDVKTGMVMALTLFPGPEGRDLHVAAAYEDGSVMVFRSPVPLQGLGPQQQQQQQGLAAGTWKWEKLYASRAHDQPVLSIDAAPSGEWMFSSAADAKVVMHPFLPKGSVGPGGRGQPVKVVKTRHAGQQGLRVRSDGRILATAGWDSRVRVYSCKTLKEVAVLKWHKEGCYAVAFAGVGTGDWDGEEGEGEGDGEGEGVGSSERTLTGLNGRGGGLAAVHRRLRNHKVQNTHWLAAGSKDGKISLWDIY